MLKKKSIQLLLVGAVIVLCLVIGFVIFQSKAKTPVAPEVKAVTTVVDTAKAVVDTAKKDTAKAVVVPTDKK